MGTQTADVPTYIKVLHVYFTFQIDRNCFQKRYIVGVNALLRAGPLALAAIVGAVTLDGGFVYDDSSALLDNPIVNGEVAVSEALSRDFWGRPRSQGFTTWRPAMPVIWAQLWKWWPQNPLPFRALSVLLHVLAVALSMRFAFGLEPSRGWAAAVGALFALHPLNTEAVGSIVAQADLLSFSLVLMACTAALDPPTLRTGLLCALGFLLASLVKESAVIFTPLAVLLLLLRPGDTRARAACVLPTVAVGAGVIALQLALPRAVGISMITSNLAHQSEGAMRLLLGLHNVGRALVMMVWPSPIAPNHGYAAVELQMGTLAPYATLGAVLLLVGVAAGVWAITRRRLEWVAALSLLYAPALLQSHWFVRLITDLAERLLYPSILGISMIGSIWIFSLVRAPAGRAAIVVVSSVAFIAASYPSRRAWADDDALWIYAVRVEPRAALHHHNVSNVYFRADDVERGAYHRLLYTYLIGRYPEPVQWEVIEQLRPSSAAERFVELPAALGPDDPCVLVRAFAAEARRHPPLHDYVLQRWPARYPRCIPSAERAP